MDPKGEKQTGQKHYSNTNEELIYVINLYTPFQEEQIPQIKDRTADSKCLQNYLNC